MDKEEEGGGEGDEEGGEVNGDEEEVSGYVVE